MLEGHEVIKLIDSRVIYLGHQKQNEHRKPTACTESPDFPCVDSTSDAQSRPLQKLRALARGLVTLDLGAHELPKYVLQSRQCNEMIVR